MWQLLFLRMNEKGNEKEFPLRQNTTKQDGKINPINR